jgi:lipid-A-disaccharide synthase
VARRILISAGEASGDFYAARLAGELRRRSPDIELFGCTGPRLREQGVRTVVNAESLAVVGLLEVVSHIPRIWGEYRKLIRAARASPPDLAILTDSPDFHLRLARRLKAMGVPVLYLIAPQAWAWRKGRIPAMRRNIDRLLCIFPFEETFFRRYGIEAEYVGHPLAWVIAPSCTRQEFFERHRLDPEAPLVTLLPGSRSGEAARHLPSLIEAVERISKESRGNFVLALPGGRFLDALGAPLRPQLERAGIRVVAGETWDAIAHADLALAASGTVTVEGALLGTPMVTFYKVTGLSWTLGRLLVDVPFYTMVNLIAGRQVVPELMQSAMTPHNLAREALHLLREPQERDRMKRSLQEVAARLKTRRDPMERAAEIACTYL